MAKLDNWHNPSTSTFATSRVGVDDCWKRGDPPREEFAIVLQEWVDERPKVRELRLSRLEAQALHDSLRRCLEGPLSE